MNISDFSNYITPFLDHIKDVKKLSHNTHKSYLLDIGQFFTFWKSHTEHTNIDETLTSFFESLYNQEQRMASIARKVSCFNSFQLFLKLHAITIDVPVKRPLIRLAPPITVPSDLLCTMFDTIINEQIESKHPLRERAMLELLYATGIRVSELIALEIGHIDFAQRSITVRGRKRAERVVHFGAKAHAILLEYLTIERAPVINTQERVFLNHLNKPITARTIQRICKLFNEQLPDYTLTPSILRNSCASHMLAQGTKQTMVQKILGHKLQASTVRYNKKSPERVD